MSGASLPDVSMEVALLAEGVDRNGSGFAASVWCAASPSSRRAWIEMRKAVTTACCLRSPSSRRAWIEIMMLRVNKIRKGVALLAEGVDRNR